MAACTPNPNASISDALAITQRFTPSEHLLISCGCVPVDPNARKVAILRRDFPPSPSSSSPDAGKKHDGDITSIVELPKGRKNIAEDIHAAALREAYEETGLRCTPLPLKVATRATTPAAPADGGAAAQDGDDDSNGISDVTKTVANCEPVALCSYPCIWTGAFKIVFWYAARADSTQVPDLGTKEAWEEDMKLEWVDARAAPGLMTVKEDGMVVEKVLEDMRRSGYDI